MARKEVVDWAGKLRGSFLACRDMGHVWHPFTARYVDADRVYLRTLRCNRCKTERVQELSMTGLIFRSWYKYPDGYAAPDGTGHLLAEDRGSLRAESIVRYIEREQAKAGNR
jgi:hypothetical protein